MPRRVDLDTLVDSAEVATILGLGNPRAVSVYRRRYEDFPAPVLERGRCLLWHRGEVESWAKRTGRLPS
jgi:predicted DNA-binding transcriptional regulator AlpA